MGVYIIMKHTLSLPQALKTNNPNPSCKLDLTIKEGVSGFSGMGMVVVCGLAGVRFALFPPPPPPPPTFNIVLTNETLH